MISSLKCPTCGSSVSYRESLSELLSIPRIEPAFGKVAILFAGLPQIEISGDYRGSISLGDSRRPALESFTIERIPGATWHDLYSTYLSDITKWLGLIAFSKSRYKVLVIDATDPVSVLAVAGMPKSDGTLVVALGADEASTPVQQNSSYVAITTALRRGFEVLVFPQVLVRESLVIDQSGSIHPGMEALYRTIGKVLAEPDDLMDLLEGDGRFNINLHMASMISSGSKRMYRTIANAVTAQGYQLPDEVKPEEVKTFYSLVWCEKSARVEFEKAFSQFRSDAYRSIIRSECRFPGEGTQGEFDIFTVFGTGEPGILQPSVRGYEEVAKGAANLSSSGVS